MTAPPSSIVDELMMTETADIDYLLDRLGHGTGTVAQRAAVKTFRTQLVTAGVMATIRFHSIGAPKPPRTRVKKL